MKNLHLVVPFLIVTIYFVAINTVEAAFNLDSSIRSKTEQLYNSSFSEVSHSSGKSKIRLESKSHKSKMDNKRNNSNPLKNVSCDFTLRLPGITTQDSTLKSIYEMESKKVLCVEFENRVSTGYLWVLIGVFNSEPTVTTNMFPMDIAQLRHHVSKHIVVTQPKMESPKKKEETSDPSQNNSEGVIAYKPPLLGGTTTAASKIKPFKTGVFYIAYAFYRPFNVTESPNIRILELHVQ